MATSLLYVLVFFLVLVVTQLPIEVESRRLVHPKRQYSNFLDNLEGVSKGQTAKGIPELRRYLKRFGYLNNEYSPDDNKEEYDEVLESAVKLYQTFFKLNVTGKLDSDTIRVMSKLRCGVPDNPVQVLSKRKLQEAVVDGKQQHKYLINIDADYAFFPGNPKWPYHFLNYRVESSVDWPEGINEERFKVALGMAAIEYTDNSVLTIEEAEEGHPPDIRTGFHRGDHGDGHPFNASILGHAFSPTDGRMHFNVDQNWSIDDPIGENQRDLVWTVIHELGHVLGLAHSLDSDAIMFPTAEPGVTKRFLEEDDVQAITTLYPFPPYS